MIPTQRARGNIFIWRWSDTEIEHPNLLRYQLKSVEANGFSGVLAVLHQSRYELMDPKVVRAVAQVSQWARHRHLVFWLQADPRQSSRSLIAKTQERMHLWLTSDYSPQHPCRPAHLGRIANNAFSLRYHIPKSVATPYIQERAITYQPLHLDRVFVFQMENEVLLVDTVKDMTQSTRFFANMEEGFIEIFGEVSIPEQQTWHVAAFPRLETNLYDYHGRKSNDHMRHYIEELFDASTYIDGFVWGEANFLCHQGLYPMSDSMLNGFIAEYQYDIRDKLYALILDTDNRSHIRVRHDYHRFMMESVFRAQQDFHSFAHSFLGDMRIGLNHPWKEGCAPNRLLFNQFDPWRALPSQHMGLTEIIWKTGTQEDRANLQAQLAITRSLACFSQDGYSFTRLPFKSSTDTDLKHYLDLLSLNSIRWIDDMIQSEFSATDEYACENHLRLGKQVNRRFQMIDEFTNFQSVESDVAVVFPIETLMIGNPLASESLMTQIHQLIGELVLAGIQLDVINTDLLVNAKVRRKSLRIGNRTYKALILPHLQVLDSHVLSVLLGLRHVGFPLYFGGTVPKYLTDGKPVYEKFEQSFDLGANRVQPLIEAGLPNFSLPGNVLGATIRKPYNRLLLLCPAVAGQVMSGEGRLGDVAFTIPESDRLCILSISDKGKVTVLRTNGG